MRDQARERDVQRILRGCDAAVCHDAHFAAHDDGARGGNGWLRCPPPSRIFAQEPWTWSRGGRVGLSAHIARASGRPMAGWAILGPSLGVLAYPPGDQWFVCGLRSDVLLDVPELDDGGRQGLRGLRDGRFVEVRQCRMEELVDQGV